MCFRPSIWRVLVLHEYVSMIRATEILQTGDSPIEKTPLTFIALPSRSRSRNRRTMPCPDISKYFVVGITELEGLARCQRRCRVGRRQYRTRGGEYCRPFHLNKMSCQKERLFRYHYIRLHPRRRRRRASKYCTTQVPMAKIFVPLLCGGKCATILSWMPGAPRES